MSRAAPASLYSEYWNHLLDEQPTLAHSVGDPRGRRAMYREGVADFARREAWLREFQRKLETVQETPAEGVNLALLRREVGDTLGALACDEPLRPLLFPFGPEAYISYEISGTSLQSRHDVEDYIERLQTLPGHFGNHRERLQCGIERGYRLPALLLPRLLQALQAQLAAPAAEAIWLKPWHRSPFAQDPAAAPLERQLLDVVDGTLRPAYQSWHDWLARDYAANGLRDSVGLCDEPGGAAYYQHLIGHHTTLERSPQELHELGLAEVERISAEQAEVAAEAGYAGQVPAYRRWLNEDPAQRATDAQDLLGQITRLCKEIDGRIPEFFARLPRMSYGVQQIPESLASGLPGAYAQPNPPSGTTGGIYWLTSLPERCPIHQHVPLTLHEGWPGHLMHIALLQEMESLPEFRRFNLQGYMAYAEGWALYCEKLGYDMGLYQTPAARFGQLEMELFRAIRLVVDPGLHALGWSRERALDYWRSVQAKPAAELEAEIDRYIGMPGQALAYKTGELEISRLRALAEQALGERFRLREFHTRLLDCGSVTLPLLAQHVEGWLAAEKGAGSQQQTSQQQGQ